MKIIIENWGPIEHCDYDLEKSILVTYGDNNIGKSYAMEVLYLLLKNLINGFPNIVGASDNFFYFYFGEEKQYQPIESMLMDFSSDKDANSLDITQKIIELVVTKLEKKIMDNLANSFENTFGTYEQIKENNPKIRMKIDGKLDCTFLMKEKKIELSMEHKQVVLKKTESDFHKSRDSKKQFDIYVYRNYIENPIKIVSKKVDEIETLFYKEILKRVNQVYFLPASRSGIYTGMRSFGPIMAQLAQNRASIKGSIQIPSISEPISDYYLELSSIKPTNKKCHEAVAEQIEKQILNGTVSFDTKKKTVTYQREETDFALEMSDVSSMVSEISPITAYLKYIIPDNRVFPKKMRVTGRLIRPSVVIFIEEPEAHLHPANQIQLIKSFVSLSKENVKLVMSSHSNYVFNELNNLLMAGKIVPDTYSPILMEYKNGKSNTYEMEMDAFGVTDNNFVDVAEQLYEERENIISDILKQEAEQ